MPAVSAVALAASAVFAVHPGPAAGPPAPAAGTGHFSYTRDAGQSGTGTLVVSNLTDRNLVVLP